MSLCSHCNKSSHGINTSNWRKTFIPVNTGFLGIKLSYQSCFVSLNTSVRIILHSINPVYCNYFLVNWSLNKLPLFTFFIMTLISSCMAFLQASSSMACAKFLASKTQKLHLGINVIQTLQFSLTCR